MDPNRLKKLTRLWLSQTKCGGSDSSDSFHQARTRFLLAAERYASRITRTFDGSGLFDQEEPLDHAIFERFDALASAVTVPDDWASPAALGWLYQFFTQSRRSRRRQGAGGVADSTAETASATGLYTPDWIASYLVENTLGQTLEKASSIEKIEKITLIDPACGCGHILLAAYDCFERAYLKQGAVPSTIPEKIIGHNLFGLDIDPAAVKVAIRLLTLQARGRFCTPPNLFSFEREHFPNAEKIGSLWQPGKNALGRTQGPTERLLSGHYDAVVTNPPYLGVKKIAPEVKRYALERRFSGRGNLDTLFIERALTLAAPTGRIGMISMQSWMFLSTAACFRRRLLTAATLETLAHFGVGAFPALGGEVVATAAFILRNQAPRPDHRPVFYRLLSGGADEKRKRLLAGENRFDRLSVGDFLDFANAELLYHLPECSRERLKSGPVFGDFFDVKQGMATGDNRRFLRRWYEVGADRVAWEITKSAQAAANAKRWFPYAKGEGARRWLSEPIDVIDWYTDGARIRSTRPKAVIRNPDFFFREALSWSFVSTGSPSFRYRPAGAIFDVGSSSIFPKPELLTRLNSRDALLLALGFLSSATACGLLRAMNPTVNFQVGDLVRLPFDFEAVFRRRKEILPTLKRLIALYSDQLRSEEISPRFTFPMPLWPEFRKESLAKSLSAFFTQSQKQAEEIKRLTRQNDDVFQEIFGDDASDKPVAMMKTAPAADRSNRAKKAAADFLSYAVGLAFGRYAIPEFFAPLPPNGTLAKIRSDGFFIERAGEISPMATALRETLAAVFGAQNIDENERVLAEMLGGKTAGDIDRFYRKEFWRDHVRRFGATPVYWCVPIAETPHFLAVDYHRLDHPTLEKIARALVDADKSAAQIAARLCGEFTLDLDTPSRELRVRFERIFEKNGEPK